MFGIVIVSHSRALAKSLCELARELSGKDIPVAYAGGVEGKDEAFGTDATDIMDAVESVYSEEGVIIFADMGSALISSETALDFIDPDMAANIYISSAPLVEGVLSSAVQCGIGSPLKLSVSEAEESLIQKIEYLKKEKADLSPPENTVSISSNDRNSKSIISHSELETGKFIIRNKNGLHARPAAKLIKAFSDSGCRSEVTNLTKNRGPVNGLSMNRLSTLEILSGDEILISADGDEKACTSLFSNIQKLVDDNFGEDEEAFVDKEIFPAGAGTKEYLNSKKNENISGKTGSKKADNGKDNKSADEKRGLVILSKGIAIGKIYLADSAVLDETADFTEKPDDEITKLENAVDRVKSEIKRTSGQVKNRLSDDKMQIIETHLFILDDPDLKEETVEKIKNKKYTAAYAWSLSAKTIIERYENLENEYLKIRSADVRDAASRVLKYLKADKKNENISADENYIPEGAVVAAEKLTPSQILNFDPDRIGGILLSENITTSHASILAKSLGIPAIGGYEKISLLREGDKIGIDAVNCIVYPDPDKKTEKYLLDAEKSFLSERKKLQTESLEPAYTKDGKRIKICANISSLSEAEAAVNNGADGVGVLRTEFLFLEKNTPPTEEEQYKFFSSIFKIMEGRPVTVRTLDVGGDKIIPYMNLPVEDNPFLGMRGVRLYENFKNLLKIHIRSMLRAGYENDLKIMIPMISQYNECRKTYDLINEIHKELEREKIPHIWPVEIGIMIETPSAVIMSNELAGISDFFSIGTNDLTQYVLASERGNPSLFSYSDPYDPSVLRAVRNTIHAAESAGIEVSLCGELGGDPDAASLLIGLGLTSLSMNPFKIPEVKKSVRNIISTECSEKCVSILFKAVSADGVREILKS